MNQNFQLGNSVLGCLTLAALSGCFTPHKESEIRGQLFDLNARLIEIEKNHREKGAALVSTSEAANQRIASTAAHLERINRDIQKLNGEVDALKVGVQTGQMPGSDPNEPSLLQTVQGLSARMENLESQQAEIMSAIDRAGSKEAAPPAATSSKSKLNDLKAVRGAFQGKRYLQVANEAPGILAKNKDKTMRRELLFYLAESLYKLGRLRDAALQFNDFLESGASGDRLPMAKLRLGDCFRHLGEPATAKIYYQEVISQHSKSSEAKIAKQRLSDLSKGASLGTPSQPGRRRG